MIAVGIIALIAAISIPNLLRARINANEIAAIQSVRALVAAEGMWRCSNPDYGGFTGLLNATPPYITGFVYDSGTGWYVKQSYLFYVSNATSSWNPTTSQNYTIIAESPNGGSLGRSFCATGDGIVKVMDWVVWPGCSGNALGQ